MLIVRIRFHKINFHACDRLQKYLQRKFPDLQYEGKWLHMCDLMNIYQDIYELEISV